MVVDKELGSDGKAAHISKILIGWVITEGTFDNVPNLAIYMEMLTVSAIIISIRPANLTGANRIWRGTDFERTFPRLKHENHIL